MKKKAYRKPVISARKRVLGVYVDYRQPTVTSGEPSGLGSVDLGPKGKP